MKYREKNRLSWNAATRAHNSHKRDQAAFLRDIETSRNFLVIESIELTRAKEGGVILSMTISVSTIFRDPDYGLVQGGR